MTTTDNNALSQAIAQANSIAAMVVSLSVDYDRLNELQQDKGSFEPKGMQSEKWEENYPDDAAELAALEEAANGNTDEDEARETIRDDALDVQVREDWKNPGEESTPSEFMILLSTGGPACRIMGELDEHMAPCRAWIEYQDWGTPWTHASGIVEQSTLLEYCNQFYFGE